MSIFGAGVRPNGGNVTSEIPNPLRHIYRGTVMHINDPAMRGRVRLLVPYPLGDVETEWAEVAYPFGFFTPPNIGDMVFVMFLNGDSNLPIVLGRWYANAEAPFQAWYTGQQANDDEQSSVNPVGNATHKPFHDHTQQQFYSPFLRVYLTPTGHYLLFNDFQPTDGSKQGRIEIVNRGGQLINISEAGNIDIFAGGNTWVQVNSATGQVTISADKAVVVEAPSVQLGNTSGQVLMTKADADQIQQAVAALQQHTHLSAGSGTPTGPPIQPVPDYTPTLTSLTTAS